MKHKLYSPIRVILCIVLLMGASVMAVTEDEAQKMLQAMPSKPIVQPAAERTMLVFSLCEGYEHGCIPYWEKALDIMSEKAGAFKVIHSKDMSIFTAESLKQFDVICFNNTTGLVPDADPEPGVLSHIHLALPILIQLNMD